MHIRRDRSRRSNSGRPHHAREERLDLGRGLGSSAARGSRLRLLVAVTIAGMVIAATLPVFLGGRFGWCA